MSDRPGDPDDTPTVSTHDLAENIIDTVRGPLVVLNADLAVRLTNRSFYRTFRVTSGETAGRSLFALGNSQWDIPELRRLLEHPCARRAGGSARKSAPAGGRPGSRQ